MRHRVVLGVVCLSAVGAAMWPAEAQAQVYLGTLNVTSLPSPCTSANSADTNLDGAAVQCAIDNLIPAGGGGELYFPAGRYLFNASLNITNKHISFRGAGQRTTRLIWNAGSGDGINFISNSGSVNHTLRVQSLSVLRGGGAGGKGINAQWQAPSAYDSRGGTSATLADIHVSYDPATPASYWQNGVVLTNALNARINSFNMQMEKVDGNIVTSTAITIAGASKGVVINDGNMGRTFYGVWVTDQSERVRLENVETSENVVGYVVTSSGGNNMISNCHAGVLEYGISVQSPDSIIVDNLLYPWTKGIYLYNAPRAQVRGNLITAPVLGIELDGTMSQAIVVANQINCAAAWNNSILLNGGVSDSLVVANDPFGFKPCLITDNGTNNVKGINKP